ncbi:NAD(P)H-binding protein [Conexibacter sp. W3-3-2]|nr:NAD(P)H-binding protein [Conexibacter sp. W3-3-2]
MGPRLPVGSANHAARRYGHAMPEQQSSAPVAVYGATGYTGKLVVAELRRRGLEVVVSGRSADSLARVAADNGLPSSAVRPAPADDEAALARVFEDCAAVIACAGPFLQVGEPVLRAAIASGTHYVDTTGEQPFIKLALERYGVDAARAGVAVVSGLGFDYLPGDLLCAVTAEGLGPLRELRITYAVQGFGATRGTMHSALLMMGGEEWEYRGGRLAKAPLRQPLGETADIPGLGRVPVARYPSGEVVTVPRHVHTQEIVSRITAATFAPHPRAAKAVPALTPGIAALLRTPLRGVLDKAIDRLPAGPPEDARRAAAYTLVADAVPANGSAARRGVLRGTDVYGITAVTTSHAAQLLSDPAYDRAGALAPAEAFDARPFLDALGEHGISYEVA